MMSIGTIEYDYSNDWINERYDIVSGVLIFIYTKEFDMLKLNSSVEYCNFQFRSPIRQC
jgi:hypothetical protein